MSLSFYSDRSQQNLLFEMDEALYDVLSPAWQHLEQKAGVFVDAYGDTVLYQDHIVLLQQFCESHKTLASTQAVANFFAALKSNEVVCAIGN